MRRRLLPDHTPLIPIVQTLYTADPAAMVHDGILYLYTTHDEDVTINNFFTMNDWRVYSSTDVVNWTDHGSPLHYSAFAWARGDAWAGQAISRNGKFYFYVPIVRTTGGSAIGVAVADSPIGPFRDALGRPLITSDCGDIDPSVFIDDDGQAYLYWGNPNLCYVRLNEDMTSYPGEVVRVPLTTASFGTRTTTDRPTTYEEGPWFYKREGRYYLVFAAGPISEHIGYSHEPQRHGAVDLRRRGHAHRGSELHQSPERHRLQRQVVSSSTITGRSRAVAAFVDRLQSRSFRMVPMAASPSRG